LLDALRIPRGHVVGISMGGGLAQLSALEFPARVASLTLVSTSPGGPSSSDLPPMRDRLKAVFDQPAEAPDWSDREAMIRYIVHGTKPFAGTCTASDAALRAVVSRAADRTADTAASLSNHWIIEPGYEPWRTRVGTIRVSTLVLHGIAEAHSLRSALCQTIMTRRARSRNADAMFANAAIGSPKNIVLLAPSFN